MDDTPRMDSLTHTLFHTIDFEKKDFNTYTDIIHLRNLTPAYIIKEEVGTWNRYAVYRNEYYPNPYRRITTYNTDHVLVDKMVFNNWSLKLTTGKVSNEGFDVFNITKIFAQFIDSKSQGYSYSPNNILEALNVLIVLSENYSDFDSLKENPLKAVIDLTIQKQENARLKKSK